MHYKANVIIGRKETDKDDSRRKSINYEKGRSIVKWYRANTISDAYGLVSKTRFAKVVLIKPISYDEYVKGVETSHEY